MKSPSGKRIGLREAFTLLEMLVVMSIMAILVSAAFLAFQNVNTSGKFNTAIGDISGILEQGRAYAIAQNTYVWVALYENVPPGNGPMQVYVGSYASKDGTDPYSWAGTVTLPASALASVTRLYNFKGLNLQTTNLPNVSGTPNTPAALPVFQTTAQTDSGSVTLPLASGTYWVIQFTPTGAARNGPNPVASIWLGIQPAFSSTVFDNHNVASMKVNGFTGLTTVYRP